jgi:hypothetical protein
VQGQHRRAAKAAQRTARCRPLSTSSQLPRQEIAPHLTPLTAADRDFERRFNQSTEIVMKKMKEKANKKSIN